MPSCHTQVHMHVPILIAKSREKARVPYLPLSTSSKLVYELAMSKLAFLFLWSSLCIRVIFNKRVSDVTQLLQRWQIKQMPILHSGDLKMGQSTKKCCGSLCMHMLGVAGQLFIFFCIFFLKHYLLSIASIVPGVVLIR